MKWLSLIGVLGGALAVLALIVVAFVVVKSNLQRITSDLWKGEAEALQARVKTLELDNEGLKAHRDDCEERLNVLSALVTGRTSIEALGEHLDLWHKEVRRNFVQVNRSLKALRESLDGDAGS